MLKKKLTVGSNELRDESTSKEHDNTILNRYYYYEQDGPEDLRAATFKMNENVLITLFQFIL